MNNPQFPLARTSRLVVQDVPDEVLVYDLDSNKAHCLNKTAATVWHACNGERSVAEIAQVMSRDLGVEVSDDLVWLAIDQLRENSLLESRGEMVASGPSRREVIKKLGLGAIVALPIVASLVAPQSALANLSCNCNQTACGTVPCPLGTCVPATGVCGPNPPPISVDSKKGF